MSGRLFTSSMVAVFSSIWFACPGSGQSCRQGDCVIVTRATGLYGGKVKLADTKAGDVYAVKGVEGTYLKVSKLGVTGWLHVSHVQPLSLPRVVGAIASYQQILSLQRTTLDHHGNTSIVGGNTNGPFANGGSAACRIDLSENDTEDGVSLIISHGQFFGKGTHSVRRGGTVRVYLNNVLVHTIVCDQPGQYGDYWPQASPAGTQATTLSVVNLKENRISGPEFIVQFSASGGTCMDVGSVILLPLGVNDACTDQPARGLTCIRARYPSAVAQWGIEGWAGIYWQYPDANWGQSRGHDLGKYQVPGEGVELVFQARGSQGGESAEFQFGGVNCGMYHDSNLPFSDSCGPIPVRPAGEETPYWKPALKLMKQWKEYHLDLGKADLSNVIGGFCWVTNSLENPQGSAIYLDDIRIEFGPKGQAVRLAEPHFIRSYVPQHAEGPDRYFRNSSYVYDNALALLACTAVASKESLRRGRLLADSFVYAQQHDRHFHDGRLRNAYACGDLPDPSEGGTARLPGWWDDGKQEWFEDEYSAGTDCGNMAWVILSLVAYAKATGQGCDSPYVQAAERLGQWIHDHAYSNVGPGGYVGGVQGWEQTPESPRGQIAMKWKSTEHNIDLFVAFTHLADLTGNEVWRQRAGHAQRFVLSMWNEKENHFWTGTKDEGGTIQKATVPLDVHPWAVLASRDDKRFQTGLRWAKENCWVEQCPQDPNARGFDFNTDRDGVWWEGTAQMQLAFATAGMNVDAEKCLTALRTAGKSAIVDGAIVAASRDGLTTGIPKDWGEWVYYRRSHVGATCWYIFAELGWNPYWFETVPGAKRNAAAVDQAMAYLADQQDQFHRTFIIYDDRDSGAVHFFPSGWMGDFAPGSSD